MDASVLACLVLSFSLGLVPFLGGFIALVRQGGGLRVLSRLEAGLFWLLHIDPKKRMARASYLAGLALCEAAGLALLLSQVGSGGRAPRILEDALYLAMAGCASLAAGAALARALTRLGRSRRGWDLGRMMDSYAVRSEAGEKEARERLERRKEALGARPSFLGNLWVDLVRTTLYLFLPLALLLLPATRLLGAASPSSAMRALLLALLLPAAAALPFLLTLGAPVHHGAGRAATLAEAPRFVLDSRPRRAHRHGRAGEGQDGRG
jgi:hypothetical protein